MRHQGVKLVIHRPETIPPIENVPPGKVRLCFARHTIAQLIVRTPESIRVMPLEDCGDHWKARPDLFFKEKICVPNPPYTFKPA